MTGRGHIYDRMRARQSTSRLDPAPTRSAVSHLTPRPCYDTEQAILHIAGVGIVYA
jgi:hypothetical protein